jgi:4-aminobutyrate aminotransferase / (S)-3-amino-2-methylpropionate transaminase / 5-aminovalerate transaminase
VSPTMTNASLNEARCGVIAKGFVSANNCYIAKARGASLFDVEGREYIDFGGGIAVMNVGHSHPKVVAAIQRQAEQFTHTCFMVAPYEGPVALAARLCAAVPGDFLKAAMFANSGAEAVENAVKIARCQSRKPAIIAFENGFHGRTLLAMTLTSKVKPYKFGFGPYAPEVYRMPFAYCYRCPFKLGYPACGLACAEVLNDFFISHVAPESTAALIVEPVQGEGGFIAPPKEYFQRLKAICEANQVMFIADEIQTGLGRTGTMFAMEHYGVAADLTTMAKSLAAGLPLSAVIGRRDIMDAVPASGIGGTYGGNPIACAAALAVMDIFEEEKLLEQARNLGARVQSRLEAFQEEFELIGDVRGLGPMMAMELVTDRERKAPAGHETRALIKYCFDRGLILLACGAYGNVVRLMMPLAISDAQLDQGLDIIYDGLDFVQKSCLASNRTEE